MFYILDYNIKTFPVCDESKRKEYEVISEFIFKDSIPNEGTIYNMDYIEKEILSKGISRRRDFLSFISIKQSEEAGKANFNPFNHGGYRYFCGIEFIDIVPNSQYEASLVQSCFFFETLFPFNSLFRDVLFLILSEVKVKRLKVFNKYLLEFGDFSSPLDFIVFGQSVTLSEISNLSKRGNLLHDLYKSSVYKEIKTFSPLRKINFMCNMKDSETKHSIEALTLLPYSIKLDTILTVIGALLQESVVVLHSESRKTGFEMMSFVLGLISPLVWPYPVIPVLKREMEDLVSSPVPLICSVEEPVANFREKWEKRKHLSPHSVHIQLETGQTIGQPPINFKEAIVYRYSSNIYYQCSEAIDRIARGGIVASVSFEQKNEAIEDLNDIQGQARLELVNLLREVIKSIYISPLDLDFLYKDSSLNHQETIKRAKARSLYSKIATDHFLNGQLYLYFLEFAKNNQF